MVPSIHDHGKETTKMSSHIFALQDLRICSICQRESNEVDFFGDLVICDICVSARRVN